MRAIPRFHLLIIWVWLFGYAAEMETFWVFKVIARFHECTICIAARTKDFYCWGEKKKINKQKDIQIK